MSGDSKKREELINQLTKKIKEGANLGIVERVLAYLKSPSKWDLVDKTAVPSGQIETKRFVICFDYLDEAECHFTNFDSAKGRALLALMKQVSTCEVNQLPSLRLIRDTIHRGGGTYQSLFNKLSLDVTKIHETEMGEGRIFYFIVENKFCIVSIESKHRNIDK